MTRLFKPQGPKIHLDDPDNWDSVFGNEAPRAAAGVTASLVVMAAGAAFLATRSPINQVNGVDLAANGAVSADLAKAGTPEKRQGGALAKAKVLNQATTVSVDGQATGEGAQNDGALATADAADAELSVNGATRPENAEAQLADAAATLETAMGDEISPVTAADAATTTADVAPSYRFGAPRLSPLRRAALAASATRATEAARTLVTPASDDAAATDESPREIISDAAASLGPELGSETDETGSRAEFVLAGAPGAGSTAPLVHLDGAGLTRAVFTATPASLTVTEKSGPAGPVEIDADAAAHAFWKGYLPIALTQDIDGAPTRLDMSLKKGEAFVDALRRAGVRREDRNAASAALSKFVNLRRIRAGQAFTLTLAQPSQTLFQAVSSPGAEKEIYLTKLDYRLRLASFHKCFPQQMLYG
ncbi:MAG: hypothetical protein AAF850_03250, partial [Pseudomonadota bacterium]